MTTIGTAVLQIIPSLRGVTEEIEKQIDGKVVNVEIAPKVDQRAVEQAAKQTRETVEKQTTQVKVEPKVDTRAAEQAGKATGEAVTKSANEAVRKGDIGKTVSDEVTRTVERSSPGKDIAKVIVDGIADGVKDELRGGPLVDDFVDGLADGVKQGIDEASLSNTILTTIGDGLKSGNIGSTIKDAVLPGIQSIGMDLRSGAADWAGGIAQSLRSGDIQGATDEIGNTVRTTTDIIANIGETFGLQLDGVREFGNQSATTMSTVAQDIQGVISPALSLKGTFDEVGGILETVLPGKASAGAAGISAALNRVVLPVWLTALLGNEIANKLDDILPGEDHPDRSPGWAIGRGLTAPKRIWEQITGQRDPNTGEPTNRVQADPNRAPGADNANGGIPRAQLERPAGTRESGGLPKTVAGLPPAQAKAPAGTRESGGVPAVVIGPDGKPIIVPGRSEGGFTGNFPVDKIAGVVHGEEFVVQAFAQRQIEKDHPGLLDHMNKTGMLPGYQGGGLVAGTSELRQIIGERFGISNIGGYRPADKYGEHSTGRALDVMVGGNKATGDAVKDFALANASAIDLKWVIWRQHLYYAGGGGYDMPDRGSPTQNHMDHVHIFSGPGIAAGLRGSLKGLRPGPSSASAAMSAPTPGAIDPASSDQTGAVDSAGGSSGGLGSVPSSLSGLSSWGLDSLGSGVGETSTGSDLGLFGGAAGSAVSGQVSSALGVFGVNDSPGWLKGISTFVGGLSISDKNGKKVFDGSNIGGTLSGAGSLFGGAAPAAPSAPAALPGGTVHGAQGGQPGPGGGPTYNIRTAVVEDAFVAAQQQEKVRLASKLDRY